MGIKMPTSDAVSLPHLAGTHLWKCLVLTHGNEFFSQNLNALLRSICKFIFISSITSTSATGCACCSCRLSVGCLPYPGFLGLSLVGVLSLWRVSWRTLPLDEGPHSIQKATLGAQHVQNHRSMRFSLREDSKPPSSYRLGRRRGTALFRLPELPGACVASKHKGEHSLRQMIRSPLLTVPPLTSLPSGFSLAFQSNFTNLSR